MESGDFFRPIEVPVLESEPASVLDSQGDCQALITGQYIYRANLEVAKMFMATGLFSVGSLQESDQLRLGAYEKAWECTQEAILVDQPRGFFILARLL